jgi:predicted oxidoreductase
LLGKAADIVVKFKTPDEVANAIKYLISEGKMKQGGLSAYDTFTHYDIRGYKARW